MEKYLKQIELIIKAKNGQREIITTVYIDSTIIDSIIDRGKIEEVNSVQFVNKKGKDSWLDCCEKNKLLSFYLKYINSEYWRIIN